MPVDPQNPASWTKPVIRLGMYAQPPFVEAANTVSLHKAFDQLVGQGRWIPPQSIGTFPVRFPSDEDLETPVGMSTPVFRELTR
ncbi:hypothetical protein [Fibrella forsythiae]|uniref:hypothetical protein n=1 Tax=Fibrella forsythiae TaxID=2817061 RepID=UPI00286E4EB1|nr:hypothetical protein [Fibrella forsythiae]